ncbi:Guanine nucleotide-binding protein subunit alpha-14 [Kappamyces sp. JEL0829]|nr:Guanine nucleotide-binding protein subunit alpha-14 [Kappamyces sp. JEL0829]
MEQFEEMEDHSVTPKQKRVLEKKKNKEIEEYLNEERQAMEREKYEPRILILGTSDSGKSTLIKQMKILNGSGFTEDEIVHYTNEVYSNVYTICVLLIDNTPSIKKDPRYEGLYEYCVSCLSGARSRTSVASNASTTFVIPTDIASLLSFFWDEIEIQKTMERGSDIGLQDTAG